MFGIGFLEICVIAVVALVFVGPKRLPELMKQAGRFFVQARRASHEVRSTFDTVMHEAETELRKEEQDLIESASTRPNHADRPSEAYSRGPEGTSAHQPNLSPSPAVSFNELSSHETKKSDSLSVAEPESNSDLTDLPKKNH